MNLRDVLRSVLTTSGGQCVMIVGEQVMLKWSALNLDYPLAQVKNKLRFSFRGCS